MWDLIPSWLADPSAYAQPENLDMTTVIVVALANLFFGLCCLAVYECVRRKTPRTYAPRIQLGHATPPPLPTNYPLQWVAPLMPRIASVDVDSLLGGTPIAAALPERAGEVSGSPAEPTATKRPRVEGEPAARRNDTDAVSAARQRFLDRRAAADSAFDSSATARRRK